LGIANNGDYIGITDFVVLDFAGVTAPTGTTLSSIAFQLNIDQSEGTGVSDWVIYGQNANGTGALLDHGQMTPTGPVLLGSTTVTGISAQYTNYIIGIEGDCDIDIESVALTYSKTPEPGTFVMAGMALIGLGLTMKKRQQKS